MPDCRRIVVLTEGCSNPFLAKTAISVLRYRTGDVVAVLDSTQAGSTSQELLNAGGNIPVISKLSEADRPDALLIGIAPAGGKLPEAWRGIIVDALRNGLHVISGLHDFLGNDPEYRELAAQHGGQLVDIRRNQERDTAQAVQFREGCLRIHSVGHDCSVGKMVATLEIERGLKERGLSAKFLATGQTGIMISGEGVPIDCVVADFVNGAAEKLVLRNQHYDYVLIEGQGSIVHPMFSAVTLGLLHGCAPDGLILCYEAGRTGFKGLDHVPIPPLSRLRSLYEAIASERHPCKVIGVAVNSRRLTPEAATEERKRVRGELGLPVCDVYRDGPDELVDAVIALRKELGR